MNFAVEINFVYFETNIRLSRAAGHWNGLFVWITLANKYSLLMHCIKIKSRAKSLLNEQYVFVGGNISFLCVLSCISEEA